MKKCTVCGKSMVKRKGETPEGISYSYYLCKSCGEEIIDMKQLHAVAEKYRKIKSYKAKLSKWGVSLGIRIPKELIERYGLDKKQVITFIPEKKAIRLVPT